MNQILKCTKCEKNVSYAETPKWHTHVREQNRINNYSITLTERFETFRWISKTPDELDRHNNHILLSIVLILFISWGKFVSISRKQRVRIDKKSR